MNDLTYNTKIIELLREILFGFTLHHRDVEVKATELGRTVTLFIQANRADTPRILGKSGRHFRALQRIIAGFGSQKGLSFQLELIEPEVGKPDKYAAFTPSLDWATQKHEVIALLNDTAYELFQVEDFNISEQDSLSSTVIDIAVDSTTRLDHAEEVGEALKIIWNAIGKAKGRLITVNVFRSEVEPSQPPTADGRFATVKNIN